jgi:preprotein translocase subunit SecE
MGEPCGRSNQLITYFIVILLMVLVLSTIAVTFAART